MAFGIGLRRHGYRVLTAASGEEALELWAAHRGTIKLLYADAFMATRLGGIELARRLRAEAPTLPIMSLPGASSSGFKIAARSPRGHLPPETLRF